MLNADFCGILDTSIPEINYYLYIRKIIFHWRMYFSFLKFLPIWIIFCHSTNNKRFDLYNFVFLNPITTLFSQQLHKNWRVTEGAPFTPCFPPFSLTTTPSNRLDQNDIKLCRIDMMIISVYFVLFHQQGWIQCNHWSYVTETRPNAQAENQLFLLHLSVIGVVDAKVYLMYYL